MGVQEANKVIARRELVGVAVFLLIGIALLVLAPKKEPAARLAAASA
jgi:hypothetical protein